MSAHFKGTDTGILLEVDPDNGIQFCNGGSVIVVKDGVPQPLDVD